MPTEPGFVTRFFTQRGFRVTSPFGPRPDPFNPGETDFHSGIDFGGKPTGTPVESPAIGKVYAARSYSGWGNLVAVTDFRGYNHLFAHLNAFRVSAGQDVARGTVIGTVGSTGMVTGPHLHYQINRPGTGVSGSGYVGNPDDYIFDEGEKEVERAIVLGSDADYFNAAVLRDRLNCPVFSRSALGSLHRVKTIYICGGPEEPIAEAATGGMLVNLSGSDRYETAAKIKAYLRQL